MDSQIEHALKMAHATLEGIQKKNEMTGTVPMDDIATAVDELEQAIHEIESNPTIEERRILLEHVDRMMQNQLAICFTSMCLQISGPEKQKQREVNEFCAGLGIRNPEFRDMTIEDKLRFLEQNDKAMKCVAD